MCVNKLSIAVSEILSPQLKNEVVVEPTISSLKLFSKLPAKKMGIKGYQSFFDDAIASEFSISRLKSGSINFGDSLLGFERKIDAFVPSSLIMMKLPKADIITLNAMDPFPTSSETTTTSSTTTTTATSSTPLTVMENNHSSGGINADSNVHIATINTNAASSTAHILNSIDDSETPNTPSNVAETI
jgi:hypothetical protein